MKNPELYNEANEATYCPEDDKIRLYVGRVPREEYLNLRKEGWTSTPKQDCDFVAVWTVSREDTAISYAGIIGDEDQSPTDRAADRAERFTGYREKRREEAHETGDLFSGGAQGYQNQDRADRAARKQNRIADKAVNLWSKAEYWQTRTAGVISNALYKSTPGVRLGRIKKLEKEQRDAEKAAKSYDIRRKIWLKINDMPESEDKTKAAENMAGGSGWWDYPHPRNPERKTSLYSLLTHNPDGPITGSEACKIYLDRNPDREGKKSRGLEHTELRLSYENQMLEAAGGKAADVEMKVGGIYKGFLIHKVNKSPVTKQVVSLVTTAPKTGYSWHDIKGTELSWFKIDVSRDVQGGYTEPTPEGIQKVKDFQKQLKAGATKKPSLINPTREAAQRLQDIWNEAKAGDDWAKLNNPGKSEIVEMTQKGYTNRSQGDYSPCKAVYITVSGKILRYSRTSEETACKVRIMDSNSFSAADHVVVITDKPQKALPEFSEKVTA